MTDFLLNFKYKGTRNYIHGTDIYARILEYLNTERFTISNIDLSLHKIARKNLKGELSPADNINTITTNPVCIFKFMHNITKPYVVHLFEIDDEVTESYVYNEDEIIDAANLDIADKSILLASPIFYNNIEKVVALNKGLVTKLLTGPGKWFFTRMTVDRDLNRQNPKLITLKLVKNIGSKITKTAILFDDTEQGYIYFSKV